MDIVFGDPNLLGLVVEELDDISVGICYLVNRIFYQVAKRRPLKDFYLSAMRYPQYRDMVEKRDKHAYYEGAAKFGVVLAIPWGEDNSYFDYCIRYNFAEGINEKTISGLYEHLIEGCFECNIFYTIVKYESWDCFRALWPLLTAQGPVLDNWRNGYDMIFSGRVDLIEMMLASFSGPCEKNLLWI